jgi:hypothetical protein
MIHIRAHLYPLGSSRSLIERPRDFGETLRFFNLPSQVRRKDAGSREFDRTLGVVDPQGRAILFLETPWHSGPKGPVVNYGEWRRRYVGGKSKPHVKARRFELEPNAFRRMILRSD